MTQQYDVTMTQQMCVTSGHGSKADDSALMTQHSICRGYKGDRMMTQH
jgi:hypothetical protein